MSTRFSNPLHRLAFVVNATKPGARALASELTAIAARNGVSAVTTEQHPLPDAFLDGIDACCVLGGDGTLLSAVPAAARMGTPVIGINQGKLGFMATYSVSEVREQFESILQGAFAISNRHLLVCTTVEGDRHLALNDVVLKNNSSRLVRLTARLNGSVVNHYNGDGLIFTTPTGSTAYSLSAGGPIIDPGANVFAMTPICPHTLSNRSIVFSANAALEITAPEADEDLLLSIDGRPVTRSHQSLPICIQIAEQTLRLAQHDNYSHFDLVREKLQWTADDEA